MDDEVASERRQRGVDALQVLDDLRHIRTSRNSATAYVVIGSFLS